VIFFENKPASKYPWTKEVWFYDFRTNVHRREKQTPEFDPRNYGYKKLGELVSASKLFKIDEKTVGDGPSKAIYLKDIRKKNSKSGVLTDSLCSLQMLGVRIHPHFSYRLTKHTK